MSEVLLGELLNCKGITYGVVKPGDYETNGIPLIKAADVENGRVNTTPNFRISREKHQEHSRTELNGGELLITLVGTPGQCAIAPPEVKGFNVVRAVGVFSVNTLADSRFIMYSIQAPESQAYIRNVCNTTVQATLNLSDFKGLPLSIPEINEQKAIAHILGTLDDKIELNRKTNETLEAMAKALFKSWFVDFDPVRAKVEGRPTGLPDEISDLFPDSFEDSELGEIPSGWKISSIYEVSSVIYGAPFSSALFNSNGEGVPVARIRDLPTEAPAIFTTEIHPKGTLIKPGDIIVGMDGEFRAYLWGGNECWMNQRVCQFVPKASDHSCFVMESIRKPLMEVEISETATTVIHLGKGDIDSFKIVIPNQTILDLFGVRTKPLLDSIVRNKKENRSLTQLRDALLPKLISGEICIPDAETMLEEAGI